MKPVYHSRIGSTTVLEIVIKLRTRQQRLTGIEFTSMRLSTTKRTQTCTFQISLKKVVIKKLIHLYARSVSYRSVDRLTDLLTILRW